MLTLISLGFLIGIAHAFEADHVAAVSALVAGKTRTSALLRHGALWGVGHTLTLVLVGGVVLVLGIGISDRMALGMEGVVGLMLIGLGLNVLYRLRRDRVHFHLHSHQAMPPHLHLHSHAGETRPHDPAHHHHAHPDRSAWTTLLVGMVHGMAGSSALILVVAASIQSLWGAVAYILLFGVGSILGMAAMSLALSVPLTLTARLMTRANLALQVLIGAISIGVGTLHTVASFNAILA